MASSSGRVWIVLGIIGGIVFVPLFALRILALLGGSGYALYSIPGNSMYPTVAVGDYIFSSANVYRNSVPPRGQVIVFKHPMDGKTDFIKRVIGLPGDRIQIRNGLLHINDAPVKRTLFTGAVSIPEEMKSRLRLYEEELPGAVTHLIAEVTDNEHMDNTEMFEVPQDHVFVLGDNRDNSSDSRMWGFVPLSLLRDKAFLIYWSTDTSRIGKRIE